MRAAVEISMYPLGGDYVARILAFIERLRRHPELVVVTNDLSTQIWGELGPLMAVLGDEIASAARDAPQLVFVLKVLPGIGFPSGSAAA